MLRKLISKMRNFWNKWGGLFGPIFITVLIVNLAWGIVIYMTLPTTYDFGNGSRLEVPCFVSSSDQRDKGLGIAIESGINVVAYNDSQEWRTLIVSYQEYGNGILGNHAFEDLAPKSKKVFGANKVKYLGMHVSVSNFAQEQRDEAARKSLEEDNDEKAADR